MWLLWGQSGVLLKYKQVSTTLCQSLRVVTCGRYLHFLRHYNDARVEAGYHKLDKSKIAYFDEAVEDLREMETTLHKYKRDEYCQNIVLFTNIFLERDWRSLGGFPNSASVFPRVKPAMQVILLWDQGELKGGRSGVEEGTFVWFYFLLLHITLRMHNQYFSYQLKCNL